MVKTKLNIKMGGMHVKMLSKNSIYRIKATVNEANYAIDQAAGKTGLCLSPYILESDSIRAISLSCVTEVIGIKSDSDDCCREKYYKDYPFNSSEAEYYEDAICSAISELRRAVLEREEFLEDFQREWDRVPDCGEGVSVHYGLRNVYLRMPLETLVKYGSFIRSNRCEDLYFGKDAMHRAALFATLLSSRPFDIIDEASCENEVLASYRYTKYGWPAFSNRVDFLGWKTREYAKPKNKAREGLMDFCNDVRHFLFWENDFFLDCKAPL